MRLVECLRHILALPLAVVGTLHPSLVQMQTVAHHLIWILRVIGGDQDPEEEKPVHLRNHQIMSPIASDPQTNPTTKHAAMESSII
jgi:hypothetical protein